MTIDEISDTLPNGFHDSDILRINIDYVRGEATFLIDVDLTSPEVKVEVPSRHGELKLTNLLYCVIEPPGYSFTKEYVFAEDRIWIAADSSDFSELKEKPKLPEPIPDGGFRHWFYDSNHNSFIYVAAMNAGFEWCE
ncbi:MAG TPA: hypothetical protein VGW12_12495 [Pyrinomonadaceae bacterium]|nr:hypothetical protein [Pyrinomonadaceae bacterium]